MDSQDSGKHKFLHDSEMTHQDVFDFALRRLFVPFMQHLAGQLGEDRLIAMLKEAGSQIGAQQQEEVAKGVPSNDRAAFTAWARMPNPRLTFEIVEDTETAFEIKVTECLWARTFREAGAAAIGYATVCHGDYAACQAFNPRIRMARTKTLMQGDDCCDHRWVWEAL